LLVVIGVREDGQKVLLALNMGGETTEAWRAVSTIWSIAVYVVLPSSSWTAPRGWKRQSPRLGRRAGSGVYGP
jgi:hypothetical protein